MTSPTNRDARELKPCPFCGPGNSIPGVWFDDVTGAYRVNCGRCGSGTGFKPRWTEDDAAEAWNTRALLSPDEVEGMGSDQPHPSVATGHPEQGALLSPQAALNDVAAERARQIAVEGWATDHDDEHSGGEMAYAAACYAIHAAKPEVPGKSGLANGYRIIQELWPWDWRWWKASTKRRDLVKAGALILAEIERLDRLSSAVQTAEAVPGMDKNPPPKGGE